jgi:NADP-dependent 3-hydroxy acid dehydrogenase YdfG
MTRRPDLPAVTATTTHASEAVLRPVLGPLLAGQVAAVTGASSGIGRAIALALAARGAAVCLIGRDGDRLASAAHIAAATSPRVLVHQADLGCEDDVERLACRLRSELVTLDVLVHSAGVLGVGSLAEATVEELDLQYRVNVRAPYRLTQALLPRLRASRGDLVFINSSAGLRADATNGLYASTKHALRALADSLRNEVNEQGIRVLSIYLGRVATPMQQALHAREDRPYDPALLLQPEDVAAMVLTALTLPRTAEVTDINMRPARKSY